MNIKKLLILAVWNLIVFLLFGLDKKNAERGGRRISELSLIELAFIFGGIGAWLGMMFFHHKTKKAGFMILIPIFAIVQIILIGAYLGVNT